MISCIPRFIHLPLRATNWHTELTRCAFAVGVSLWRGMHRDLRPKYIGFVFEHSALDLFDFITQYYSYTQPHFPNTLSSLPLLFQTKAKENNAGVWCWRNSQWRVIGRPSFFESWPSSYAWLAIFIIFFLSCYSQGTRQRRRREIFAFPVFAVC